MNSVRRPPRRLPQRVYWTRRALVLGVVALLVFGVVKLFSGSGTSTPDTRPASAPVASPTSGLTPSATVATSPSALPTSHATHHRKRHRHRHQTPTPEPLAVPTGPCQTGDIVVTPSVKRAYAGRDVTVTLDLTTKTSPACTWEVSPQSVVVELTSGSDRIWSSQDCPGVIGQQSVVVRKDHVTKVSFDWGGRRSDLECSNNTLWAQPGWYHVKAAAFGADPTDEQFHLLPPPRPTITKAPKPRKRHNQAATSSAASPSASSTASPAGTPSATPTH